MAALFLPSRERFAGPPVGAEFRLNRASDQARGLRLWLPLKGDALQRADGLSSATTVSGPKLAHTQTLGIARGFGTVLGTSAADRITTGVLPTLTAVSYSVWLWRNGDGPGGLGRAFVRSNGPNEESIVNSASGGTYLFVRQTTGTNPAVSFPRPSASAWHHILVTNDGTVSTPTGWTAYVDGVAQTVSTQTSGTGTMSAVEAVVVGNYIVGLDANWDGYISDLRAYDRVLTAREAAAMYDPATRWELFSPLKWRVYAFAAAAADTTKPTFASASVPSNGATVAVVLTEAGSPPILPATGVTGFTVTVAGSGRTISSATASSTTVNLALASPVLQGQTVTVAYTPGNVTDSASPTPNAMDAFGAQSVTNNSTVQQAIAPNHASIRYAIPETWVVSSTNARTNLQGACQIIPVTIANNEPVAISFDTSRLNGITAALTPTIAVEMDGVFLDLNSDGLYYRQLPNNVNSVTWTLIAAPANGKRVFRVWVRSHVEISGSTLGSWGSGGSIPPVTVDITAIVIGSASSMASLVSGTDYYPDTALLFSHSRGVGVLANVGQGVQTSNASAANNNALLSWIMMMRKKLKCEIGHIGQGGLDLAEQLGTFFGSSPVNPPMYGASGLGSGEMFATYMWNGLLRTVSSTHKYIFILQGVVASSQGVTMMQNFAAFVRTTWGTTPWIFWVVDPTLTNRSNMQTAFANPSDRKLALLDRDWALCDGSTPSRYAPDGSHMNTEGQAVFAATVMMEMQQSIDSDAMGPGPAPRGPLVVPGRRKW